MTAAATPTGHPRGLYLLFFAEMWERFCYYGMRAILTLFFVDKASQFHYSDQQASLTYGAYTALVYGTALFGGLVADRLLGFRRAILLGGVLMAIGEFALMLPGQTTFFYGLALISVGNGLFKPNISSLVGRLYAPGDPRRDAGFSIFYMGINVGAGLAPLLCGWVGEEVGWVYGFGLAGLGMLAGVVTFGLGQGSLGEHGLPPQTRLGPSGTLAAVTLGALACVPLGALLLSSDWLLYPLVGLGAVAACWFLGLAAVSGGEQRGRFIVLVVLLTANFCFWTAFEQAGSSFTLFAKNHVDRDILGWIFPTSWFQSVNPALIIALAPLFAALWPRLDRAGWNPSVPAKFGWALIQGGLGFAVLVWAARFADPRGLTPFLFLTVCYLLHTTGELCLSPIGLSMMTKLAPPRMAGLVMGAWFLSTSVGLMAAGKLASLTGIRVVDEEHPPPAEVALETYTSVFWQTFLVVTTAGVVMLLFSRLLNRLLHGIK